LIDVLIISQEGSRGSETPSGGEEGGNNSEASSHWQQSSHNAQAECCGKEGR
jgi:hypothetical protein